MIELARLRKQRLLDALALYKMYNEAEGVEQWISEKSKLLHTMTATDDIEEVEILKARFDTFDQELNASSAKMETVNTLASQLVQNEHPNADDVTKREKEVSERWAELREVADNKRDALQLAHGVNTWHIECQETMVRI